MARDRDLPERTEGADYRLCKRSRGYWLARKQGQPSVAHGPVHCARLHGITKSTPNGLTLRGQALRPAPRHSHIYAALLVRQERLIGGFVSPAPPRLPDGERSWNQLSPKKQCQLLVSAIQSTARVLGRKQVPGHGRRSCIPLFFMTCSLRCAILFFYGTIPYFYSLF